MYSILLDPSQLDLRKCFALGEQLMHQISNSCRAFSTDWHGLVVSGRTSNKLMYVEEAQIILTLFSEATMGSTKFPLTGMHMKHLAANMQ